MNRVSENNRDQLITDLTYTLRQRLGLAVGPVLFLLMLFLSPPAGMGLLAWRTADVAILMAIFWMTEAIPIPVTALLPMILFPVLKIAKIKAVAAPFANPLIYLFMGGFIIALGMQRWGLHKRMALSIIKIIGTRPRSIIAGFMVSCAFLSMWVSNTATTLMMLPIGLSVIELLERSEPGEIDPKDRKNFAVALMLGIAYSSSIGGVGTLIGTPPNALMAGFLKETYGYEVGFAQWMLIGVPLVVVGLPISYLILTRIIFPIRMKRLPGGADLIYSELKKLGPVTHPEKMVALVFGLVAILWMTRPVFSKFIPGWSDTGIAILGAFLLFVLPAGTGSGRFLLDWKYAENLPWGVLILFGGGLSLASAINNTGLASWIGKAMGGISFLPLILIIMIFTTVIILLTELNSNTATAAAFLPLVASIAIAVGQNPLLFVLPITIAASCAFMLPVATPPNAIVYGSGKLNIPEMVRAGVLLVVFFIILITLFSYTIIPWVFHIQIGVLPDWTVLL